MLSEQEEQPSFLFASNQTDISPAIHTTPLPEFDQPPVLTSSYPAILISCCTMALVLRAKDQLSEYVHGFALIGIDFPSSQSCPVDRNKYNKR